MCTRQVDPSDPSGHGHLRSPSDANASPGGYDLRSLLKEFWPSRKRHMESLTSKELRDASRNQVLPLARVKKIMKIDEEVKQQMISADAPLILSVAAEFFVEELTLKAWKVTDEGRRKTLQKFDISNAVSRLEHMDFLIDIVPRVVKPQYVPLEKFARDREGHPAGHPALTAHPGTSSHVFLQPGSSTSASATPIQVVLDEGSEMMVQLENGQMVKATQIAHPIQLPPQAVSQLGFVPPASSSLICVPSNGTRHTISSSMNASTSNSSTMTSMRSPVMSPRRPTGAAARLSTSGSSKEGGVASLQSAAAARMKFAAGAVRMTQQQPPHRAMQQRTAKEEKKCQGGRLS